MAKKHEHLELAKAECIAEGVKCEVLVETKRIKLLLSYNGNHRTVFCSITTPSQNVQHMVRKDVRRAIAALKGA